MHELVGTNLKQTGCVPQKIEDYELLCGEAKSNNYLFNKNSNDVSLMCTIPYSGGSQNYCISVKIGWEAILFFFAIGS